RPQVSCGRVGLGGREPRLSPIFICITCRVSGNEDQKEEGCEDNEVDESGKNVGSSGSEGQKTQEKGEGKQQDVAPGKADFNLLADKDVCDCNRGYRQPDCRQG